MNQELNDAFEEILVIIKSATIKNNEFLDDTSVQEINTYHNMSLNGMQALRDITQAIIDKYKSELKNGWKERSIKM